MKIKFITQLSIAAAGLLLAITSASAIDLLAQYPTDFVTGDTKPENARPWDFKPDDIYRISRFNLSVGDKLTVTLGSADLGIGHCTNGAVWAVLIPREEGTLTSSVTTEKEPVANVWLRFHPAEIDRLFPPDTVSTDGDKSVEGTIRKVVKAKFGSSWHSDMNAMIPEPKDMTVYVDTKTGSHRFFVVDTQAKSAEYVAAFDLPNTGGGGVEVSAASIPPVVVKTVPESGATDVPPGETELRVTFSKPMRNGSWSWSTAWEDSTPEFIADPVYDADGKTCVARVKLESGKTYGVWLNSQKFHNFKDTQGRAAVPYLFVFQTKGE